MKHTVYLALGTNLGDRMINLTQALVLLTPYALPRNWSRVYQTPPWGYLDQPAFLNMVVEAQTELEPLELLDQLKLLEENIGREKSFRFGPRLIDLDILFYDDVHMKSERLEIPHLRIAERAFVLVPLAELAPDALLQSAGQTIAELLARSDSSNIKPVTNIKNGFPGDIAILFAAQPETLENFIQLPASHQREHLAYILEAKRPATRLKRFERTAAQLALKKD